MLEFKIIREINKNKDRQARDARRRDRIHKGNGFNLKTDIELEAMIKYAKRKKAKQILLDLEAHPGEPFSTYVWTSRPSLLTEVVVGMKGRFDKASDTLYAAEGRATKLPVVALVSGASAAEILAGAPRTTRKGRQPSRDKDIRQGISCSLSSI